MTSVHLKVGRAAADLVLACDLVVGGGTRGAGRDAARRRRAPW